MSRTFYNNQTSSRLNKVFRQMNFGRSSESFAPVTEKLLNISFQIVGYLEDKLASGILQESDWKIFYCPILFPDEFDEDYPERFRVDRRRKILYLSPKLDYYKFLISDHAQSLELYLDGIRSAFRYLPDFGCTQEHLDALDSALVDCLNEFKNTEPEKIFVAPTL